ncbi:MAG TPA: hypothetical protein VFU71_04650 [Burkholderiaceae bacterium]|nr:hypothetical protein [Burkholderiaceae bacterium]
MTLSASPALSLRRQPALQRERLGWCLLVVIAAHAMLLAPSLRQPAASTASPAAARAVQVRLLPQAEPAAAPAPHAVATNTKQHREARPASAELQPASANADAPPIQRADPDAGYVPRAELTVAPQPMSRVAIDYPAFDGEADRYSGEFELFIDDSGAVVRVICATPDLPPILAHAVREAFGAARFTPAEVDGLAVRSRIRIEVTFDIQRPTT